MHTKFKTIIGILLGVFIEYFDYTLYAFNANQIAGELLPREDAHLSLTIVWLIFAAGFIMRPFGALFFGHLGDKFGRRKALILGIILMCLSTILIGCIPAYSKIGFIAAITLLILRALQGFSVSTEYTGASTYLLESAQSKKGLLSGIITAASGFGIFCASLLTLVLQSLKPDYFIIANWRVGFIVSGIVVGILGVYLRRKMPETEPFLNKLAERKIKNFPLKYLLQTAPITLIKTTLIMFYVGSLIICLEVFLPNFLHTAFGVAVKSTLQLSTFIALIEAVFAVFWGWWSDFIGYRKTLCYSAILVTILITPTLYWMHTDSILVMYLSATLIACLVGSADGPAAAYLVSKFNTECRVTGTSLSYSVGAGILGGFSPSLLLFLYKITNLNAVVGIYLLIIAMLALALLTTER